MIHRQIRFLLLCFFVVLQALAPFVHAHPGPQPAHHGFLHLHAASAGEAAGDARSADTQGAYIDVGDGVRPRPLQSCMLPAVPVPVLYPTVRYACALPAIPDSLAPPAHSDRRLPPALAPPAA